MTAFETLKMKLNKQIDRNANLETELVDAGLKAYQKKNKRDTEQLISESKNIIEKHYGKEEEV